MTQRIVPTIEVILSEKKRQTGRHSRIHAGILALLLMSIHDPAYATEKVTYFVLAETVEPIMIVRDGNPMAGGIMTEIVTSIFEGSEYELEPKILPWQRMRSEFKTRDDWIVHGFPESFEPDIPYEMSELAVFPFNHTAVTLRNSNIRIRNLSDLNHRTLILVENFQYAGLDDYLQSGASVAVVRAFTPSGALEMLKHRRGDVVIDWQARIIYNLPSAGLAFEEVEFHDAANIVPTEDVHLVFSPRQTEEFRNFVNDRIRKLTDSGKLLELVEKYYKPAVPPEF